MCFESICKHEKGDERDHSEKRRIVECKLERLWKKKERFLSTASLAHLWTLDTGLEAVAIGPWCFWSCDVRAAVIRLVRGQARQHTTDAVFVHQSGTLVTLILLS